MCSGSTDSLTATNRSSIVQKLVELKNQIYQEGNTNYAGRYVFTGYKTDSSLTFMSQSDNLQYDIKENFTGNQIQGASIVKGGYELRDFDNSAISFEDSPQMESIYRIQLSYDKLDNTAIDSIRYSKPVAGGESEDQPLFTNIKTISAYESDAYSPDPDSAHFLYETGELILGKSIYEEFRTADDIELTYRKSNFDKGDLKPEHYFDCV